MTPENPRKCPSCGARGRKEVVLHADENQGIEIIYTHRTDEQGCAVDRWKVEFVAESKHEVDRQRAEVQSSG